MFFEFYRDTSEIGRFAPIGRRKPPYFSLFRGRLLRAAKLAFIQGKEIA
jgi:hypothetical protein